MPSTHDALIWQCGVLGALVILSMWLPGPGDRVFRLAARACDAMARRPWVAIGSCASASFLSSAIVARFVAWPEPAVHDEFAYLLAADTFANGRLTNPSSAFSVYFETFHVLVEPSYVSKYPPGQGLVMALGQRIFGHPLVGVWLSGALLCGSLVWMFFAWLPRRWALFGGAFAVATFGCSTYWTQSYWGGAMAAAGGALVFGAVRRILDDARVSAAFALGAGLFVLAVTRPFEGLVTSVPVAFALAVWLKRKGSAKRGAKLRVVFATLAVLVPAAVWLGVYNHAVTGDAMRLPYVEYASQYEGVPTLLVADKGPVPEYRHDVIRDFWKEMEDLYDRERSLAGYGPAVLARLIKLWRFYLGPIATLALVVAFFGARRPARPLVLTTLGLGLVVLLLETYDMPHYAAPLTALVLIVVVDSLRATASFRIGKRRTGRGIVVGLFVMAVVVATAQALTRGGGADHWSTRRAAMLEELESDGAQHLVLVRYGPSHSPHDEWVYNRADLEGATVLWARDLGPDRNAPLLDHFTERSVWLVKADYPEQGGPTIEPYRR